MMIAPITLPKTQQTPGTHAGCGPIVLAAGGTGGHFFPAEALARELSSRGHHVVLMTDARSGGERSPVFAAAHVLQGAGLVGRGPVRAARGALALAAGTLEARRILAGLAPAVIVAFGGYPSVPPVLAASLLNVNLLRRRPAVILHEGNAMLGGANRALARFADHLALGFTRTGRLPPGKPTTVTGLPIRPGFARSPYHPPEPGAPIRLLVTGGSLGARILGRAVPAAIAMLPGSLRARLAITQQCRAEDMDHVRAAYAAAGVTAELATFLEDMPRRVAEAHFMIGRAGASTVAELAAVGRPALLIPLPSPDSHQRHNAEAVDATYLDQAELQHDPAKLADLLSHRLDCPDMLAVAAHAIAAHGIGDAARRLADLVEQVTQPPLTQPHLTQNRTSP